MEIRFLYIARLSSSEIQQKNRLLAFYFSVGVKLREEG